MSSKATFFLSKTLGEDFVESLEKFELWKPDTRSVTDHNELFQGLRIVPRTIMSLLIKELTPMSIDENKEIKLPVESNSILKVTKHGPDTYSGEIIDNNKKLTEFKFRPIPGVGLVIMSCYELYNVDDLVKPDNTSEDASNKIQRLIDERLALRDLIEKVVDKKMMEREAIHKLFMLKLSDSVREMKEKAKQVQELRDLNERATPQSDPYFQGMTNGLEVANAVVNDKEPKFVEAPKKKGSPLKDFLDSRKNKIKKNEFAIEMAKGETVSCPDCGKSIFDGQLFSGCICLGDDREKKVFIKKTEEGIKIRFGRGWDQDNIEMLLEVLRRKHG